jgi:hypothetical protein
VNIIFIHDKNDNILYNSYFSTNYASLFSITNLIKSQIKSEERNALTDETIAACVSLKITKYTHNIKTLSARNRIN